MSYEMLPPDRFFQVHCYLPEREIRSEITVCFNSLVDLTSVEAVRAAAEQRGERRPSYTSFVVRALALAMGEYPYANRRVVKRWLPFLGPRLQSFQSLDVGVAVERQTPRAESVAFVDVLRHAERYSLAEISHWLQELSKADETNNEQWRQFSKIMRRFPAWLGSLIIVLPRMFPSLWPKFRGGAALVSSPGKYGVDNITAAWAWPLGVSFGYVKPRPLVVAGQVVARPTFSLIMNFDRRVMAGAQAARFFARMVELLETAEQSLASLSSDTSASQGMGQGSAKDHPDRPAADVEVTLTERSNGRIAQGS